MRAAAATPPASKDGETAGGTGLSATAGWINVVVAAVIMLATLPGRTQGLGLITEPMLRDLQLDRVTYATVNLWATLLGAAICLPIGRLFDRFGLRWPTVAITLLLGAVVWTMSWFAGGRVSVVPAGARDPRARSERPVGREHHRGRQVLRQARRRGDGGLLGSAQPAVRGGVHRGRELGADQWLADGLGAGRVRIDPVRGAVHVAPARTARLRSTGPDDPAGSGLSLSAALRTPAFWVFAGATSLFGLVSSGLGLFNEAVLAERGFDQQTYVRLLAGTSIIALAGQMTCGWLTLRWSMPRLLGIAMLCYARGAGRAAAAADGAASLGLRRPDRRLGRYDHGHLLRGVAAGIRRVQLGRIQGAAQMLTVIASAVGPLIFAQSAAWTGSYFPALWILAPCVLLVGVAAFRVSLPQATRCFVNFVPTHDVPPNVR